MDHRLWKKIRINKDWNLLGKLWRRWHMSSVDSHHLQLLLGQGRAKEEEDNLDGSGIERHHFFSHWNEIPFGFEAL